MQLYIPEIGDQIRVTAPWTFNLYREWRNHKFQVAYGLLDPTTWKYKYEFSSSPDRCDPVTIVENTILGVDRVYIRKGAAKFSSVTFISKNGAYKGKRFWAKLIDVNRMEFEIVESAPNAPRPKKFGWDVTYEGISKGSHGYISNEGRFRLLPIFSWEGESEFLGWQLVDYGNSVDMGTLEAMQRKAVNILRKEKQNAK